MEAFAARAAEDGTDSTAQTGGDLGFFARGDMVPEFADALFDAEDPQQGDIIGPVRSEFGWHVIMFDEARGPLAERLAAVQEALAADGADFATVAAELSDGAEAAEGGETGWQVIEDLDAASQLALEVIDVGAATEPIASERGWVIYQKLEEATRPLEGAAGAAQGRHRLRRLVPGAAASRPRMPATSASTTRSHGQRRRRAGRLMAGPARCAGRAAPASGSRASPGRASRRPRRPSCRSCRPAAAR